MNEDIKEGSPMSIYDCTTWSSDKCDLYMKKCEEIKRKRNKEPLSIVITGRSGEGKSYLLNCMVGIQGTYSLFPEADANDIKTKTLKTQRRNVEIVIQLKEKLNMKMPIILYDTPGLFASDEEKQKGKTNANILEILADSKCQPEVIIMALDISRDDNFPKEFEVMCKTLSPKLLSHCVIVYTKFNLLLEKTKNLAKTHGKIAYYMQLCNDTLFEIFGKTIVIKFLVASDFESRDKWMPCIYYELFNILGSKSPSDLKVNFSHDIQLKKFIKQIQHANEENQQKMEELLPQEHEILKEKYKHLQAEHENLHNENENLHKENENLHKKNEKLQHQCQHLENQQKLLTEACETDKIRINRQCVDIKTQQISLKKEDK